MLRSRVIVCLVIVSFVLQSVPAYTGQPVSSYSIAPPVSTAPNSGITPANSHSKPAKQPDFAKLPISFEPNVGQTDPAVRFMAHTRGGTLYFTPEEVQLAFKSQSGDPEAETNQTKSDRRAPDTRESQSTTSPAPTIAQLHFIGANPAPGIQGGDTLPGKVSYFLGNDPSKWHTNLPTYGSVVYADLYPGIDLEYDGNGGQLKSTYTVAPGADPTSIRWSYEGAERVWVDEGGNLQVRVTGSEPGDMTTRSAITVTEQAPTAWQDIDGRRVIVSTRFDVRANGSVGFAIERYSGSYPLTLDPTLVYTAFYGAGGNDEGSAIGVDAEGNGYVTGSIETVGFRAEEPGQVTVGGRSDAYLAKINPAGTAMLGITYLGGSRFDKGTGISVDGTGNVYVSGYTYSTDFRVHNPFQPTCHSCEPPNNSPDGFIVKYGEGGSEVVYSSYLGGSGSEYNPSITVDNVGNAYIAGGTDSLDFPLANPFQPGLRGTVDAFVTKVNPQGSALAYSTYLGGDGTDEGSAIAVDAAGNAFLTGYTLSNNFPVANAYQSDPQGVGGDAFVTKLNPQGSALVYSTYLGGDDNESDHRGDRGWDIAVDAYGSAYVTGWTPSTDFPTVNAFQPTCGSCIHEHGIDGFLTKFSPDGSALTYSTYLGGENDDAGRSIAVDGEGNASLTGETWSEEFPLVDAIQTTKGGDSDAFVTKFNAGGADLIYSTYLGGSVEDYGQGIAVDGGGNAYITGRTTSYDFPSTYAQATQGQGSYDAFIVKIADRVPGPESNEIRCGGNPSMHSSTASAGDLIDTANGNLCHSFTDITIPGRGVPLMFARTYNSLDADVLGPLGYGWTHSYNMFIERDQAGNYLVHQENGSVVTFGPDFSHPDRVLATLAQVNDEYIFTRLHGQVRFYFKEIGPGDPVPIKLDRIADRNKYTTTLHYDQDGRLESVSEPGGRALEISYESPESELIFEVTESVIDHSDRSVQFRYESERLVGANDVGGRWTHYTYYDQNLINHVLSPNGHMITDHYDEFNRGVKQEYPESRELELGYTDLGFGNTRTRITDTLGLITLHDYELNKLTKVTQYPGGSIPAEWDYSYDSTLGVTMVNDPLDHPWSATWDANGNMTSSSDPLGRAEQFEYTAQNDLQMVTNAAGYTTTYAYDTQGNPLSIKRKWVEENQVVNTTFTYDKYVPGDVLTITNPLGKNWGYRYNTYGYLTTATDPLGYATRYENDNVGRVLSITDPRINTTTFTYNDYDEVLLSVDPLGHSTAYGYDEVGNLKFVTDPKGNTTTNTYNLNSELTRVTQPDGTHTDYKYDAAGRVLTQTNPLGENTTYKYEDLKRRVKVTDPLIRTTTNEYDAVGNLKTVRHPGDILPTIIYSYDPADQLINIHYNHLNTPEVTFVYDNLGLRQEMIDGTGTTLYDYDSLDRLKMVRQGDLSTVEYGYDKAGNITQTLYPQHHVDETREILRFYDDANRLRKVNQFNSRPDDHGFEFEYDPNGNVVGISIPTGNVYSTTIGYDANNRVISHRTKADSTTLLNLLYTRDSEGLVLTSTETVLITSTQTVQADSLTTYSHTYAYDRLDRLTGDLSTTITSTSNTVSNTWVYDHASQITNTHSFPATGSVGASITSTRYYDDAGQMEGLAEVSTSPSGGPPLTYKSIALQYSPTGNRTQQMMAIGAEVQTTTYSYDLANRLIEYVQGASAGAYSYNGDGLRMSKRDPLRTTDPVRYTWDVASGLPLLLSALDPDAQDARHDTRYTYGPGGMLLAQSLYPYPIPSATPTPTPNSEENGTEQEKVKQEASALPPNRPDTYDTYHYLHLDQLGNVRIAHNNLNQYPATWAYDAYGNRHCTTGFFHDGCEQLHTNFGYAGQYTDPESGLQYLRARYYDPATESFLTRDPREGSTGQPYAYANGNPLNVIDPSGMEGDVVQLELPIGPLPVEQSNGTWWQPSLPGFWDMFRSVGQSINGAGIEGGMPAPQWLPGFEPQTVGLSTQVHHYATNKGRWEKKFREIANKYGLDLDESWNKEALPFNQKHPPEYHRFVYANMKVADEAGQAVLSMGGTLWDARTAFLSTYERFVKAPVRQNPMMLRRGGWGRTR